VPQEGRQSPWPGAAQFRWKPIAPIAAAHRCSPEEHDESEPRRSAPLEGPHSNRLPPPAVPSSSMTSGRPSSSNSCVIPANRVAAAAASLLLAPSVAATLPQRQAPPSSVDVTHASISHSLSSTWTRPSRDRCRQGVAPTTRLCLPAPAASTLA
jgi:hypothetical protein